MAVVQRLLVVPDEQVEVVVLRLRLRLRSWRRLVGGRLALVPGAHAQVFAVEGVDQDGLQRAERIVADLDLVAPKVRVDLKEQRVQLHIGEGFMDRATLAAEEVLQHLLEIDVPGESVSLVIAFRGRLPRFAVRHPMVALVQPGRQGAVEPIEREDVAGVDLAFELALRGAEETLDESAGRRNARTCNARLTADLLASRIRQSWRGGFSWQELTSTVVLP
ncbi:MAG: hypothetical protein U1E05_15940 [Patescibacteria group bacterium]|nr:hypothetical protein [Patescibacteria group bacterium]